MQLLIKIPNDPCRYRHTVNGTYYGIKKLASKRKEHSLGTDDRKIVERKLKTWISELDRIDTEAEQTNLAQLIEKLTNVRQRKPDSTKATALGIVNSAGKQPEPAAFLCGKTNNTFVNRRHFSLRAGQINWRASDFFKAASQPERTAGLNQPGCRLEMAPDCWSQGRS